LPLPQEAEYARAEIFCLELVNSMKLIKKTGHMYGVTVIDIFLTTQAIESRAILVSAEDLHPHLLKNTYLGRNYLSSRFMKAFKPR